MRKSIAVKRIITLCAVLALAAAVLSGAGCAQGDTKATATPERSPLVFITPGPETSPTEYVARTPIIVTAVPTDTPEPTEEPTPAPSETPTPGATKTPKPTATPTPKPTEKPTEAPTEKPTDAPTATPTEAPTEKPTEPPTPTPAETDDSGEWDISAYYEEEDDLPYARYYIEVSLKAQLVYIYSVDSNGDKDQLVKTMICSSGRDGKTPVRSWIILDNETQDNEIRDTGFDSRYDFEWVKGCAVQYITRMWKAEWDENGKLKVSTSSYLFHSTPYDNKYDKDSLRPEDWNKLGTAVSDGCIRLCARDAHWIYSKVAPYSIVRTVEGEADPETWARLKLPDIPLTVKHDPTDVW